MPALPDPPLSLPTHPSAVPSSSLVWQHNCIGISFLESQFHHSPIFFICEIGPGRHIASLSALSRSWAVALSALAPGPVPFPVSSQTLSRPSALAMARPAPGFDILQDASLGGAPSSPPPPFSPTRARDFTVLNDIAVDTAQNANTLPADLDKFCTQQSAKKSDPESILKNKNRRGSQARAPIGANTFVAPQQKHAHFELPLTPATEPKSKALEG